MQPSHTQNIRIKPGCQDTSGLATLNTMCFGLGVLFLFANVHVNTVNCFVLRMKFSLCQFLNINFVSASNKYVT